MKIEMDYNTSVSLTIISIILIAAITGMFGCRECELSNRAALRAGVVNTVTNTSIQKVGYPH